MTDPRLALLAWLTTFAALLLRTGVAPDAARGEMVVELKGWNLRQTSAAVRRRAA